MSYDDLQMVIVNAKCVTEKSIIMYVIIKEIEISNDISRFVMDGKNWLKFLAEIELHKKWGCDIGIQQKVEVHGTPEISFLPHTPSPM